MIEMEENTNGLCLGLIAIQNELKAPKNQYNSFGKYKYRNCEDILEAVKPLLLINNIMLTLSDKVVNIGEFTFIEATCRLVSEGGKVVIITKAQAGIEKAKGMSLAQSFGSCSSYARKYSLNAMFLIDDTKDDDTKAPPKDEPKKEDRKPIEVEFLTLATEMHEKSPMLQKMIDNIDKYSIVQINNGIKKLKDSK